MYGNSFLRLNKNFHFLGLVTITYSFPNIRQTAQAFLDLGDGSPVPKPYGVCWDLW